jgi:hypothetical protein
MKMQKISQKKSVIKNSTNILHKDTIQVICEQFQIIDFPHKAPKNYEYQIEPFKNNVVAIWIHHLRHFDYNHGEQVRCIWGFHNSKTKKYFSPINSKTIGKCVNINETTPYSAMILKENPLLSAFV